MKKKILVGIAIVVPVLLIAGATYWFIGGRQNYYRAQLDEVYESLNIPSDWKVTFQNYISPSDSLFCDDCDAKSVDLVSNSDDKTIEAIEKEIGSIDGLGDIILISEANIKDVYVSATYQYKYDDKTYKVVVSYQLENDEYNVFIDPN